MLSRRGQQIEVPSGRYLNVVGDVHGQLFDFLSCLAGIQRATGFWLMCRRA